MPQSEDTLPLTVPELEAKLLYLAMAYQLVQPGWQPGDALDERGEILLEAKRDLEPQVGQPTATLHLTAKQIAYLETALLRMVNELKVYSLLDEMARTTQAEAQDPSQRHRRSATPDFDETLLRLFPEVRDDPDYTSFLAGRVVRLRRLTQQALRDAPQPETESPPAPEPPKRGIRRFWRF